MRPLKDRYRISIWMQIALLNFFIAALIGATLRFAFLYEIPGFNYRHFLHAHSHGALLGWLFTSFFCLIIWSFTSQTKPFILLFLALQSSIVGMFVAFPIEGYGFFSIFFSSCHIVLSYLFIFLLVKAIKKEKDIHRAARHWLLAAVVFLILSSFGTWALGPIMNSSFKGSSFYYAAIQFYLHFQFNGWFVFVAIALFLRALNGIQPIGHSKKLMLAFALLFISCLLTYALAVTWSNPDKLLFWSNSLGVILQLLAWGIFCQWLMPFIKSLKANIHSIVYRLWLVSFLSLTIKIVIQSAVAIPSIAVISYTIHNFVIGFIHLLMLGCLSTFVLGCLFHFNIWNIHHKWTRRGLAIFIFGIFTTEGVLFYQGLRLWMQQGFFPYYYEVVFGTTLLLPLGIGIVLVDVAFSHYLRDRTNSTQVTRTT